MKKLLLLFLLLSTQAWATTRYVDGSLGSSCVGQTYRVLQRDCGGTATDYGYKTIATGLSNTSAGDTLYLRQGTYAERIANTIPAGTDNDHRTIFSAYNSETVTIAPGSGSSTIVIIADKSYITFDGITVDGTGSTVTDCMEVKEQVAGLNTTYVTVQNCIFKNTWGGGTGGAPLVIGIWSPSTSAPENISVLNNTIYNCGMNPLVKTTDHCLYVSANDSLIEGNTAYGASVGHGFHFYKSGYTFHGDIVRNNIAYDNGSWGFGFYSGAYTAYNNISYHNGIVTGGSGGIAIRYGASNTKLYNNTVYNNTGVGVRVDTNISNAIVRNNISYSNSGAEFSDSGSGTTFSNNLCDVSGTGCSPNLIGNPKFANAGTGDLHITEGSLAIDTGCHTSTCSDVGTVLTTDLDGLTRANGTTTGSEYDVGAYEFQSPPSSISVLTPNGGESVEVGATLSITWSSVSISGNVHIELTRNGSSWEDIAASTTNDGALDWVVTGSTSTTCKVRITNSDDTVTDSSDANFTISSSVTPTITIVSPTTGSRVVKGNGLLIRWTSTDLTGNVSIELSRNNGSTWETLYASVAYSAPDVVWTATIPASSVCKIRITSLNDAAVTATSNAFRIGGTYLR